MINLPQISQKARTFVILFTINHFENASKCYREAYDCKNSSDKTIQCEASKLLKNPKVSQWIEYAKQNCQQVAKDELNYTIKDCFDELDEVRQRAKKDKGNYSQEIKAIELKGKLAGHFIDKHQVTGGGLADVLDQLK